MAVVAVETTVVAHGGDSGRASKPLSRADAPTRRRAEEPRGRGAEEPRSRPAVEPSCRHAEQPKAERAIDRCAAPADLLYACLLASLLFYHAATVLRYRHLCYRQGAEQTRSREAEEPSSRRADELTSRLQSAQRSLSVCERAPACVRVRVAAAWVRASAGFDPGSTPWHN